MVDQPNLGNEQEQQQEQSAGAANAAQANVTSGGLDYSVDFIWGSDQDQYVTKEEE
ncbi:hypothetical protein FHS18_005653 [Paenibacillus phyllosphaerae]|uniref:Uncharacterized protein n=1 Tax=Paenibacillus phyllosphaerae TaxID=274593 RepID=A0A7W5B4I3_9BACL|nr:hypothetical protein [Paenibacillus phyllosphaerae]MBB3113541.1 hypothetical protein [Paenibacillus phyllosphaerae]